MKRRIVITTLLCALMLVCCTNAKAKDGTNIESSISKQDTNQGEAPSEIVLNENISNIDEVSLNGIESEKTEEKPPIIVEPISTEIINANDKAIDDKIKETLVIYEGEKIEKAEWITEGSVFRVAIMRTEEDPIERNHLRDYIYVKKNGEVKSIEIRYPSFLASTDEDRFLWPNCFFDVKYEDVTFDGNEDVLISLGKAGQVGDEVYCAYVYDGDDYVYTKSFEDIRNYEVNKKESVIDGWRVGYGHNDHYVYKYENGEFVFKRIDIYEYEGEVKDYVFKGSFDDLQEALGIENSN